MTKCIIFTLLRFGNVTGVGNRGNEIKRMVPKRQAGFLVWCFICFIFVLLVSGGRVDVSGVGQRIGRDGEGARGG